MVSKSGKYDVVSIHDMSVDFGKMKKRSKFETETKLRKMKETSGCHSYSISIFNIDIVRIKESLYLCVSMPKTVIVMKWVLLI